LKLGSNVHGILLVGAPGIRATKGGNTGESAGSTSFRSVPRSRPLWIPRRRLALADTHAFRVASELEPGLGLARACFRLPRFPGVDLAIVDVGEREPAVGVAGIELGGGPQVRGRLVERGQAVEQGAEVAMVLRGRRRLDGLSEDVEALFDLARGDQL